MSFYAFFVFSAGLRQSIYPPTGTKDKIWQHIRETESALHLEIRKYQDNPQYWEFDPDVAIPDDQLCKAVQKHND